jgi:hypothetical protein
LRRRTRPAEAIRASAGSDNNFVRSDLLHCGE